MAIPVFALNDRVLYRGGVLTAMAERSDGRWYCDEVVDGAPQARGLWLLSTDFYRIGTQSGWIRAMNRMGIEDPAVRNLAAPIWVEKDQVPALDETTRARARRRRPVDRIQRQQGRHAP